MLAIEKALQHANTICHIANSIGKIDTDAFEKYCHNAYRHLLESFPFAKVKNSIHWSLAHLGKYLFIPLFSL